MEKSWLKQSISNYTPQKEIKRLVSTNLPLDQAIDIHFKKCGAKTRKGKKCQAAVIPGANRCRFHGGLSTGPKTPEGKKKALANLKQYQNKSK